MEMDALSVSRINTNNGCNWKYALQYHLKLPELRRPTIYTDKGVAVHEVLELYANGKKEYEKNLLEYYKKSRLWELDQRKPEKGGFPHPFPKTCETCPWNDNSNCLLSGQQKDSFLGCPRPNFEDDLDLIKRVVERKGETNFLGRKILGIEYEFDEIIEGVRIKGVIDLITELDNETLEIIDYKTGRHSKGDAALQKDPQVRIYSVVAKLKWPQYKYRLMTLDFLRKKPISIMFSDEDDKKTIEAIKHHDNEIRTNNNPFPKKYEFWLCKFCVGHERCNNMHNSLRVNGKFKLPVLKCNFYLGDSEGSPPCWGPLFCYNEKEITDDLKTMLYSCQGHKEIPNGGIYQFEPKTKNTKTEEEVIERD